MVLKCCRCCRCETRSIQPEGAYYQGDGGGGGGGGRGRGGRRPCKVKQSNWIEVNIVTHARRGAYVDATGLCIRAAHPEGEGQHGERDEQGQSYRSGSFPISPPCGVALRDNAPIITLATPISPPSRIGISCISHSFTRGLPRPDCSGTQRREQRCRQRSSNGNEGGGKRGRLYLSHP